MENREFRIGDEFEIVENMYMGAKFHNFPIGTRVIVIEPPYNGSSIVVGKKGSGMYQYVHPPHLGELIKQVEEVKEEGSGIVFELKRITKKVMEVLRNVGY